MTIDKEGGFGQGPETRRDSGPVSIFPIEQGESGTTQEDGNYEFVDKKTGAEIKLALNGDTLTVEVGGSTIVVQPQAEGTDPMEKKWTIMDVQINSTDK